MLDFRKNARGLGRGGASRRRRLLLFFLLLGVTVLVVNIAMRPHLWRSLDRCVSDASDPSNGGIDNRVGGGAGRTRDLDNFTISGRATKAPGPTTPDVVAAYFPGVDATQLKSIRDDRASTAEDYVVARSWFDILRKADLAALRRASLGPTSYAQLFRQPESYRGRLVTVSGVVRRACRLEFPRAANDANGIGAYYQAWLFPTDNPRSPIVVYALELPAGFPTGMTIAEDATVTGFFLKRWLYASGNSLRAAPTLLARTLEWQKRPVLPVQSLPSGQTMAWILLSAALSAALLAWYVYSRTRPFRVVRPEVPPNFDSLDSIDLHGDV